MSNPNINADYIAPFLQILPEKVVPTAIAAIA
jgi:hypothetical protein